MINFESHRDKFGHIDLKSAFMDMATEKNLDLSTDEINNIEKYFLSLTEVNKIYSRQVAALTITTAEYLFVRK